MMHAWERQYPGRTEVMLTALQNVAPSHLMDERLFDFKGVRPSGHAEPEGDTAFDAQPLPTPSMAPPSGLPGVGVISLPA
jgi:tRNA 2-thiocytidine biosynthesis protein TtcA